MPSHLNSCCFAAGNTSTCLLAAERDCWNSVESQGKEVGGEGLRSESCLLGPLLCHQVCLISARPPSLANCPTLFWKMFTSIFTRWVVLGEGPECCCYLFFLFFFDFMQSVTGLLDILKDT